ncbi:MAG: TlyA family rRNA (cytidine-2'-O)-methyltransferase [Desulfobulbaceae bacterium]
MSARGGKKRKRLDLLLQERGLAGSREQARQLIMDGEVLVDGFPAFKAEALVPAAGSITLRKRRPYVSRGGLKLEAGLARFGIDPGGMICADVGCSTGGFTDCLLQHGAARVYSVDVGYGVLDWKLRKNERVVVLERTNARYLTRTEIPEPLDLAVIDASFISLELLLAPVQRLFEGEVTIIALVKPQFELPREKVATGGVVRDGELHRESLEGVREYARKLGLVCADTMESPILGAKGNREFLMLLTGGTSDE